MKEWNTGGCNFTCIKTRKTTIRKKDSACSPIQWCTLHSLNQQGMQLGRPSKNLVNRVKCKMLNLQNDLKEEKKHTQELEATNQTLRGDIIDLVMESCAQERVIASRNIVLANMSSEIGLSVLR